MQRRQLVGLTVVTLAASLQVTAPAPALGSGITFISFDDAPFSCYFVDTAPLRGRYAAAKFSGPSASDGGAVLDDSCSNFGVSARTGTRFLAFNSILTIGDSWVPRGPEKIKLPVPQKKVSIWVSQGGGPGQATFKLTGKRDGKVVSSTTASTTTSDYVELALSNKKKFDQVVLSAPVEPNGAWVADDLTMSN